MGYQMGTGVFADTDAVTLIASAAYTVTTTGTGYETDRGTCSLTLDVTACTGTLDVTIETSVDNATWRSAGTAFTQATGVTSARRSFTCDRFVRAVGTIVTGPATFSVSGEFR